MCKIVCVLAGTCRFYHGDIQSETETDTWPSTVIFITSTFMYIGVAFSFSKGPPFRKPLYTNGIIAVG